MSNKLDVGSQSVAINHMKAISGSGVFGCYDLTMALFFSVLGWIEFCLQ